MGLFKALIRTTVNVVKLPVMLPVAIAKDLIDYSLADEPTATKELIEELKEEADTED